MGAQSWGVGFGEGACWVGLGEPRASQAGADLNSSVRPDGLGDWAGSDSRAPRPGPLRAHLQVLDEFTQENVFSLYKFNLSWAGDAPAAQRTGPEPDFRLDRRTLLQRLSKPDQVGFRLVRALRVLEQGLVLEGLCG